MPVDSFVRPMTRNIVEKSISRSSSSSVGRARATGRVKRSGAERNLCIPSEAKQNTHRSTAVAAPFKHARVGGSEREARDSVAPVRILFPRSIKPLVQRALERRGKTRR